MQEPSSFHYLRRKHSKMFKSLKSSNDDRNPQTAATFIPHLPDNVIENVISFLPIDRAAQANTVSKQWSTLWPSFPEICLDEECFSQPQRFLSFLHHSLRRCRNQRQLDKLSIRANLEFSYSSVSEWVDFAIELCVKELDILDLDVKYKMLMNMLVTHDILTLKSLTSLKLENVRVHASSGVDWSVSLPSLKTMSLKDVVFLEDSEDIAILALVSGSPCIEHLSIVRCKLGYSTLELDISSDSLKSLDIIHCDSLDVSITAKNLESFTFYSYCTCAYHRTMFLWECDSLEYLDISCKGLKMLLMHNCIQTIENSFHTPNLEYIEFSGYLKGKVLFVEAPLKLVKATIRIWEMEWSTEYYFAMRDFLESFDCSNKVKIHIDKTEGVIIPEECRIDWSPPLPCIKQLQLYFTAPLGDNEYCLRRSLVWMAPSAEILPFLENDDAWEEDDKDYGRWMARSPENVPFLFDDDDDDD